MRHNGDFLSIQPTDAALFINGLHFDMDYVDIFTLLDTIKSEANVLNGLGKIGLSDEQARKVVALDFSGSKQTYGIDIRFDLYDNNFRSIIDISF